MVWNGRGLIWRIGIVFIFPTRQRCQRWLAIVPDKWKLKFVPLGTDIKPLLLLLLLLGTSAMDFAHYQSPKLLGSSAPTTHKHGIAGTYFWLLSDISVKSGRVGKTLNPRSPGIFPKYENQALGFRVQSSDFRLQTYRARTSDSTF